MREIGERERGLQQDLADVRAMRDVLIAENKALRRELSRMRELLVEIDDSGALDYGNDPEMHDLRRKFRTALAETASTVEERP
jgi:regulator of replication initiation timing